MTIYEKLANIQQELFVPKNNNNDFGKYKYRSCEDILVTVKPLLTAYKCTLMLDTSIEEIAGRHYVMARATLRDLESADAVCVHGYAREEETKKGMDSSQVTGSCTSYARKYALAGLFCIDNEKDSDATNDTPKTASESVTSAKKEYLQYMGTHSDIDKKKVAEAYKVNSWTDLTEAQAQHFMKKHGGQKSE